MEQDADGRLPFAYGKQVEAPLLEEYQRIIVAVQKESMDLLWVCIGTLLTETDRGEKWHQAERAMENQFRKEPKAQPRHVARRVRLIRGIEVRLSGLLLARAQMIKRRVVMRQRRGGSGKEATGPRQMRRDFLAAPVSKRGNVRRRELLQQFEEVVYRMSRRRDRLLEICLTLVIKNLGLVDEWTKVNAYMDAVFQQHPSYTPWRVASQTRHYHGIHQRMMPKLICLAQRAKQRMAMRKKRRQEETEDAIWGGLEDPLARETEGMR